MDPLFKVEQSIQDLNAYMHQRHRTVFGRYPLVFGLLGAFGVAAILYGFEGTLDELPFFHAHPWVSLVAGVLVLAATGSLYRRLERKTAD